MKAIVFYFRSDLSANYFECSTVEDALEVNEELLAERTTWEPWQRREGRVPMPKIITGKFLVEEGWK